MRGRGHVPSWQGARAIVVEGTCGMCTVPICMGSKRKERRPGLGQAVGVLAVSCLCSAWCRQSGRDRVLGG